LSLGAYESGDQVPGGIIADAFYSKGRHHPEELMRTISDLIRTAASRAAIHQQQSAPVWIPRNGKDSKGVPFTVRKGVPLARFQGSFLFSPGVLC